VILSDFSMPGFNGMAALALAREICPDTPVSASSAFSGTIGEESCPSTRIKSGATDYLLKNNLVRLSSRWSGALREGKSEPPAARGGQGEFEAPFRERSAESIVSTLPDVDGRDCGPFA